MKSAKTVNQTNWLGAKKIKFHFQAFVVLILTSSKTISIIFHYQEIMVYAITTIHYGIVLEQTPKYKTLNTPNIECLNIELSEYHILSQNRTSKKFDLLSLKQFKVNYICDRSNTNVYTT